MRIFAVDENNDIHLDASGQLALNINLAALLQACEHVMQSLLGEMVFSVGRGLPWRETIWTGNPNLRLFENASRNALLSVKGVRSVREFSCVIDGNVLRYQATIESIYGQGIIEGNANG